MVKQETTGPLQPPPLPSTPPFGSLSSFSSLSSSHPPPDPSCTVEIITVRLNSEGLPLLLLSFLPGSLPPSLCPQSSGKTQLPDKFDPRCLRACVRACAPVYVDSGVFLRACARARSHAYVTMDPVSSPLLMGPLWLPPQVCKAQQPYLSWRGALCVCVCVCLDES